MFFSVKKVIKIDGKVYVPCVCYSCPKQLELTVEKLASEEKAVIYEESVGFMNGKVLEKAKPAKKTVKKAKKTVAKEEPVKEETLDDVIINEVKDPLDETETF